MEQSDIFEKNYQQYCAQLAEIDFGSIKDRLGITGADGGIAVPFFNEIYLVTKNGITDATGSRANYVVSVILAKYILLCPDKLYHDPDWASFKDFKRNSQFTNVNYFSSDTEKTIEKQFSGRLDALKKACGELGGFPLEMDISYDVSVQFDALPRISMLLLFNDKDNAFPAKCTVLFQKHAEFYLDPESLAMTGAVLAKSLTSISKRADIASINSKNNSPP
ncbi:MAG: DUF3786 domain-containing protein [Desulfosalsimonadaceae bacterium]|nr:DUF3786 domain-containing protein [Desulfosalsimonadaceae bacterium]